MLERWCRSDTYNDANSEKDDKKNGSVQFVYYASILSSNLFIMLQSKKEPTVQLVNINHKYTLNKSTNLVKWMVLQVHMHLLNEKQTLNESWGANNYTDILKDKINMRKKSLFLHPVYGSRKDGSKEKSLCPEF